MNDSRRVLYLTGMVLFAAVVFVVDVLTPTGIEIWVFYLPVILFLVLLNNPRQIVIGGAACSVLVVLGWFFSPEGSNPPLWDVLNRSMGLVAIWLAAFRGMILCTRSAQLAQALADLQQETDTRKQTQRVLSEHEERLRLAIEGAGMGTWDLNLRTGKVVWSQSQFRMLGYQPVPSGEASREMWLCRVHPDDRNHVLESQQKARCERSLHCAEYRICRPESQVTMWLAVFGRFLYDAQGEAIRFVGVSFGITRRKELENEVLRSEVLRITAREQLQIGQELHDGVGQEVTGLGLMAQSLAQRLPEAAQERRIAARLVAGLDHMHRQVRELARGLIPVHVETRGLSAALKDLAARTTEQSGIEVTCECPEWVDLPDHQTATEMFRIAQEAVANALRHGRPQRIRLTLLAEPDGLRLRIKDDGIGVQGRPQESDGLGLRIMEYRAGLIGGVLQIGLAERGGTIVTLALPRRASNDAKEPAIHADRHEGLDRG
jgi:PAS domain S-box-containing protein